MNEIDFSSQTALSAVDFTAELMKTMTEMMAKFEVKHLRLGTATKPNLGEIESITASFDDSNIAPAIYPSRLYEEYKEGKGVDELAEKALGMMQLAKEQRPEFDLSSISAANATDHLYMVLINKELNPDIVEKCPHLELNDLVGVPRWRVSSDAEGQASILVTKDVQTQLLHMPEEEICRIARANTCADEFTIKGMTEVMMEMMGNDMPPEFMAEMLPPPGEEQMYVVSNASKLNGAGALLDRKTLDRVTEIIGEDNYFVIPSSLHEVLAIPESKVSDPADLKTMCEEVNATQVAPQDLLGSNIYRYDGHTHKLQICNDREQLKEQLEKHQDVAEKHSVHVGRRM